MRLVIYYLHVSKFLGFIETEDDEEEDKHLRWPREDVLLLIRCIEERQTYTGLKKHLWMKIATEINKVTTQKYTPEQIDSKWKGLKRTYKKIKDHNNRTGNNAKKWDFFAAIDAFMGKKPEIQPIAVCSSSQGLKIHIQGNQRHFCCTFSSFQYL